MFMIMENSNLFILSSLWEELGFVIVEAAFKNLFIVSSNCPNGPSEFIEKIKEEFYLKTIKKILANALNSFLKIENRFKEKLYAKENHIFTLNLNIT